MSIEQHAAQLRQWISDSPHGRRADDLNGYTVAAIQGTLTHQGPYALTEAQRLAEARDIVAAHQVVFEEIIARPGNATAEQAPAPQPAPAPAPRRRTAPKPVQPVSESAREIAICMVAARTSSDAVEIANRVSGKLLDDVARLLGVAPRGYGSVAEMRGRAARAAIGVAIQTAILHHPDGDRDAIAADVEAYRARRIAELSTALRGGEAA